MNIRYEIKKVEQDLRERLAKFPKRTLPFGHPNYKERLLEELVYIESLAEAFGSCGDTVQFKLTVCLPEIKYLIKELT